MKTSKAMIGLACVVVSAGAIAGGIWLQRSQAPLAMPTSADEALDGLSSEAYQRMDDQRRRQYAFEAGRLLRDRFREMTPEEREALREDEALREALERSRQDMFDEMVRRAARGEGMERPDWGRRGGEGRPDTDEMTPEQRERMEEMRDRMRERIAEQLKSTWDSGDAQSTGLRQEFFKNMGGGARGGR